MASVAVLFTAALLGGVPVNCYSAERVTFTSGWYAPAEYEAFYLPRAGGGPLIGIREPACRSVQHGSRRGAWLLAHELRHFWQDTHGLPFDEQDANEAAHSSWRHVQARVRRYSRLIPA
jgi:hypothetical protein